MLTGEFIYLVNWRGHFLSLLLAVTFRFCVVPLFIHAQVMGCYRTNIQATKGTIEKCRSIHGMLGSVRYCLERLSSSVPLAASSMRNMCRAIMPSYIACQWKEWHVKNVSSSE